MRRFILSALRTQGYRTLEAGDGEVGIATFLTHRDEIDLVLSDIEMPHRCGTDMVGTLLQLKPSLAVAFVSGTPESCEMPADLAHVPVLKKPFSADEFLHFVRQCILARQPSVTRNDGPARR